MILTFFISCEINLPNQPDKNINVKIHQKVFLINNGQSPY